MHDYTKATPPPFFRSSYSFKRAVEELDLHEKALLACANLLHVTTMAKKKKPPK